MIYPAFSASFNEPISDPCTISVKLVTNSQPASSSLSPPAYFTVGPKTAAGKHKLIFEVTSNTQVKTYNGNAISCDLSVIGVNSCSISYQIEVIGLDHGTATIQTQGVIEVKTECIQINLRYSDPSDFYAVTHLGGLTSADRDANMDAGYEIRKPKTTFNLPYFIPTLKSGDSIISMCGPLLYTVTVSSSKAGPYNDAFTIINHDGSNLKPVVASVETNNQDYALFEGRVSKDWQTKYDFKISACWQEHPD